MESAPLHRRVILLSLSFTITDIRLRSLLNSRMFNNSYVSSDLSLSSPITFMVIVDLLFCSFLLMNSTPCFYAPSTRAFSSGDEALKAPVVGSIITEWHKAKCRKTFRGICLSSAFLPLKTYINSF